MKLKKSERLVVTRRDKFLLYVLAIFLLLFCFIKMYVMPKLDVITQLDSTLAELEEQSDMMKATIAGVESLKTRHVELLNEHNQIAGQLNQYMEKYEIDHLLTGLIINEGLSVSSLNFSYYGESGQLTPYGSSAEVSNADTETQTSPDIYCAKVTAVTYGSAEASYSLLDRLLSMTPGLRVIDYRFETERQQSGTDENGMAEYIEYLKMTIKAEFYMIKSLNEAENDD